MAYNDNNFEKKLSYFMFLMVKTSFFFEFKESENVNNSLKLQSKAPKELHPSLRTYLYPKLMRMYKDISS